MDGHIKQEQEQEQLSEGSTPFLNTLFTTHSSIPLHSLLPELSISNKIDDHRNRQPTRKPRLKRPQGNNMMMKQNLNILLNNLEKGNETVQSQTPVNYSPLKNLLSQSKTTVNTFKSLSKKTYQASVTRPVSKRGADEESQKGFSTKSRNKRAKNRKESVEMELKVKQDDNKNNKDDSIKKIPLTPCRDLSFFRFPNLVSIDDFHHLRNDTFRYIYQFNPKGGINLYEPLVTRKPGTCATIRERKEGNYALCPYCPASQSDHQQGYDKLFYKRNDSNYLHHLVQYHGIYSSGEYIQDPINQHWKETADKNLVEFVQCFYCPETVSLKKFSPDHPDDHRLLKYLRHVVENHKSEAAFRPQKYVPQFNQTIHGEVTSYI